MFDLHAIWAVAGPIANILLRLAFLAVVVYSFVQRRRGQLTLLAAFRFDLLAVGLLGAANPKLGFLWLVCSLVRFAPRIITIDAGRSFCSECGHRHATALLGVEDSPHSLAADQTPVGNPRRHLVGQERIGA